jgi:hypothetical protein
LITRNRKGHIGKPLHQRPDGTLALHPCQLISQTEVFSEGERNVPVWFTPEVEHVRALENGFVAIG